MSKFNIGDEVRILSKEELISKYNLLPTIYGRSFRGNQINFLGDMWKYCGQTGLISCIKTSSRGFYYKLKGTGGGWSYDEDMLEPVLDCFDDPSFKESEVLDSFLSEIIEK